MKKKILLIISAILVLSLASVAAVEIANRNFDFGKKIAEINNSKDKGEVIAIVNGEKLFQNSIDGKKLIDSEAAERNKIELEKIKDTVDEEEYNKIKKSMEPKTDKELFEKLIAQTVIKQDVEKLKITVTKDEIDKAVDESIKVLEDSKNDKSTDFYDDFVATISGMGYTMEDYKIELLPIAMEGSLLSQRHYEIITEKIKIENPEDYYKKGKEYYENYVDSLVKNADVEILNDNFK